MIQLDAVEKRYHNGASGVAALAGIDLLIERGEYVAITGPSGSGKSSLLNVLGCLDKPSLGRYLLDGRELSQLDDEAISEMRNRQIGFVFQSFHLLPRLSVIENVLLPIRFARHPIEHASARAKILLERVGLSDRLEHRPSELSGGQMQRAAIARALIMEPALLLADEPTGNLDSKSAADVLTLIDELHVAGQTVVLVTHDHDVAARAPRHVRLLDGKVAHDSKK